MTITRSGITALLRPLVLLAVGAFAATILIVLMSLFLLSLIIMRDIPSSNVATCYVGILLYTLVESACHSERSE